MTQVRQMTHVRHMTQVRQMTQVSQMTQERVQVCVFRRTWHSLRGQPVDSRVGRSAPPGSHSVG